MAAAAHHSRITGYLRTDRWPTMVAIHPDATAPSSGVGRRDVLGPTRCIERNEQRTVLWRCATSAGRADGEVAYPRVP
jgi:hypothetical protein